MTPDPEVINMLWVSGPLPWYAQLSIRSFLKQGHRVHLYHFGDVDSIPEGCEERDANGVLDRSHIFGFRGPGRYAGYLSVFADWFRYELLLTKGGWWSDADVVAMKSFGTPSNYVFASSWEPTVPNYVNNNVIFVPEPGAPIMVACAEACRNAGPTAGYAETGPVLLNRMVCRFGLERFIEHPSVFNPIHYGDVALFLKPKWYAELVGVSRRLRGLRPVYIGAGSKGVHLFAANLRSFVDIHAQELPPFSLLSYLDKRS